MVPCPGEKAESKVMCACAWSEAEEVGVDGVVSRCGRVPPKEVVPVKGMLVIPMMVLALEGIHLHRSRPERRASISGTSGWNSTSLCLARMATGMPRKNRTAKSLRSVASERPSKVNEQSEGAKRGSEERKQKCVSLDQSV